jgi:CHASE1-domain containing sensor protein
MPLAPAAATRHSGRPMLIVVGLFGVLMAGTLALWAWYGTAVFTEMVLAGLAACF